MEQSEFRIHKACVDYLEQRVWQGNKLIHRGNPAFEDLLFFHVANQGHSKDSASEGFFLKQLGVLPGAYDLMFFWGGRNAGCIDIKDKSGHLSSSQQKFRSRWERCGFPSASVTTVTGMRDKLIEWGAKCVIHAVREPDTRTFAEKKKDAFDFYKPYKPE